MKWMDFKKINSDWDYHKSSSLFSYDALYKNKRIWRKYGKEICEYYTKQKAIKINYIDYSNDYQKHNAFFPKTLIILILDESGKLIIFIFSINVRGSLETTYRSRK